MKFVRLALLVSVMVAPSCTLEPQIAARCKQGEEIICAYSGPEGTEGKGDCHTGVKTCQSNGTWSECIGEVLPVDAKDCVCVPGMASKCYDGPKGTEDLGVCRAGIQVCNADGRGYGACLAATLPQVERCDSLEEDENCDGIAECEGNPSWNKSWGDSNVQGASAIAIDPAGDIILTGGYQGVLNFGGDQPGQSSGSIDVYLAKLSGEHPSHDVVWVKHFGDSNEQIAYAIATDRTGDIVIAGRFMGSIDFHDGNPWNSLGDNDVFVAKFNASGEVIRSFAFGGPGDDRAYGVAMDDEQNIYLTGYFNQTVAITGENMTSFGSRDIFLVKFDADLKPTWSKKYGGPSSDRGLDVVVDTKGNIVISGDAQSSLDFGGGLLPLAGVDDAIVAKFDPEGNHLWSKRFGSAGGDACNYALALDSYGNVVLAGSFKGDIDFGGEILSSLATSAYVTKFAPNGSYVWSSRLGSSVLAQPSGVVVDNAGNIILGATFSGTVNYSGGALTSAGGYDALIAKFDGDGDRIWIKSGGDAADQYVEDVAVDGTGRIFATGLMKGNLRFSDADPLSSNGDFDAYIYSFSP